MNLFFSKLLLQKRADKIIISPKMLDDEMDFWLTCVGFGMLKFSRENTRIRGKQDNLQLNRLSSPAEDQYQYR